MKPLPVLAGIAAGGGFGATYWLGRTWGATAEERRVALPGDEIVESPHFVTDHAVTLDATPEEV
jgi:hypothetical protein